MNKKRYWLKLLLNIIIIALEVLVVYSGYMLFTHKWEPIQSVLIFLSIITSLVFSWKIANRRSFRWQRPGLAKTTFVVLAIIVICTFAGIEPMASYKDGIVSKLIVTYENYQDEAEARREVKENRRIAENAKMTVAGIEGEWNFYEEYITLFNEFRAENSKSPLTFDAELNKLATQRAKEISEPNSFSHEGIRRYNLGENIAMMAYSSDSPKRLIELWASSPGHRSNMLSSSYYRTGFAKNGKYVVQIFD